MAYEWRFPAADTELRIRHLEGSLVDANLIPGVEF